MRKKFKGGYTYASHNEDSGRKFNISDEDKALLKKAIISFLVPLIIFYLLYKLATLLIPKLGWPATIGIIVGIIIIILLAVYFGLKWYRSRNNSISMTSSIST
jgi:predicted permease